MKTTFIITAIITLIAIKAYSQAGGGSVPVTPNQVSINDKSSMEIINPEDIVLQASKMNVLYCGVENPISLVGPLNSYKNIQLSCRDSGVIIKKGTTSNQYIIEIVSYVGKCTITLSTEFNNVKKETEYPFRIKSLPNPIATISNRYRAGLIGKDILISANLTPVLDNFDFMVFFNTIKFKVMIIKINSKILEFEVDGNKITKEIDAEFNNLEQKDRVIFYDIVVNSSAIIRERTISPMLFTIK
jgi:hypothetical protein